MGTNPRALTWLSRVRPQPSDGTATRGRLTRATTPFHAALLGTLSPVQRRLVEILADGWCACSVNHLADATLSAPQSCSSSLGRLREIGLVRARGVGRTRWYELTDQILHLCRTQNAGRLTEILAAAFSPRPERFVRTDPVLVQVLTPSEAEHVALESYARLAGPERRLLHVVAPRLSSDERSRLRILANRARADGPERVGAVR